MDKELKGLVMEIISLVVLLIVVVPICVHASNDYQEKKDILLNGTGTSVDISHNGTMKKVTIYSDHDDTVSVNLILKISKFADDYEIYLDEDVYNIRDLSYTEDSEYQYYNLGIYEVNKIREFDFQLRNIGKSYYDETITYSFMTEGLL